jgi:hypothetical protein
MGELRVVSECGSVLTLMRYLVSFKASAYVQTVSRGTHGAVNAMLTLRNQSGRLCWIPRHWIFKRRQSLQLDSPRAIPVHFYETDP